MTTDRVLVTGATGIVGSDVVREFLRESSDTTIIALIRGTPADVQRKREWLARWAGLAEGESWRLRAVSGDITQSGLGLSAADDAIARSATTIVHAGAVTRFDQDADAAFRNNVRSTQNVLAFAKRCPTTPRVGIVSTAHVAGNRVGTVFENELELAASFHNEYERSKALAESCARDAMAEIPLAIFRLSIVVGRRSDGCVSRLNGVYPVLRLFHRSLLAMFPGAPDQCLDIVPVDFVAASIHHLLGRGFQAGTTYHVCAGNDLSFTLSDFFAHIASCIACIDPAWKRRGQPLPLHVTPRAFQEFVEIVELTANRRLREIIDQTKTITRHLESPKTFDTTALRRDHGSDGPRLEHAREWLQAVIAYAIARNWQAGSRGVRHA